MKSLKTFSRILNHPLWLITLVLLTISYYGTQPEGKEGAGCNPCGSGLVGGKPGSSQRHYRRSNSMKRHSMSWRDFIFNLILTLVMIAGFVYAAREGMLSAIAHMDEIQAHVERRAGR